MRKISSLRRPYGNDFLVCVFLILSVPTPELFSAKDVVAYAAAVASDGEAAILMRSTQSPCMTNKGSDPCGTERIGFRLNRFSGKCEELHRKTTSLFCTSPSLVPHLKGIRGGDQSQQLPTDYYDGDQFHQSDPTAIQTDVSNNGYPQNSFIDDGSGSHGEDPALGTPSTAQQPIDPGSWELPDQYHETVQDRLDEWKRQQREQAAATMDSDRDEKGRMKLLTSVSRGARVFVFGMFVLRNMHLYEIADQTFGKGLVRLMVVTPVMALLLANLTGSIVSFASPSQSAKKRLKAILNLDKVVEVILILYYIVRLTFAPPQYIPREIYVGKILHSIFFIMQSQAYTRVQWDETSAPMNRYPMQSDSAGQAQPSQKQL